FYYPLCLIVGLAPWSVFLGPTIAYALGRQARADEVTESWAYLPSVRWKQAIALPAAYRFLWCWVAVYLLFFSASATKLPNYVLPVYPPLAVLTARFLDRWRRGMIAPPGWVMHASLVCLVLIGVSVALGLMLASGAIEAPFRRKLPGLETWAAVGIVPVLGAAAAWWCLRRQRRTG